MKSCRNFSQKPLDPAHRALTSCFVAFRTIWVHLGQFVALQHSFQNGANWCKSSCHEVASDFFTTNAPDPPHWTLDSCFGASRSIWVHLAMFRYYTKLGAKRVELVQLMQSLCHDVASEFFAMNTPNPPHWSLNSCIGAFRSVWVHFGLFRYCTKLVAKQA